MPSHSSLFSPASFDVEIYLHGRCHLFALALNKALGYPIEFMWSEGEIEEYEEDAPAVLEHAYCRRPDGTLVDASGTTTIERITGEFSAYGCDPEGAQSVSLKDVNRLISQGRLEKPRPGEIAFLTMYIQASLDVYMSGSRSYWDVNKGE